MMKMIELKFLGNNDNLKQSTCIKLEISPILNCLLQSAEYLIALLTIPIDTEFDISVPTKAKLKRAWASKNDRQNLIKGILNK